MSRIDFGTNILKPQVVPATAKAFLQAADSDHTARICAQLDDIREQLLRGELKKEEYDEWKTELKRELSFYTPHAHFLKGYKSHDGEPVDSRAMLLDIDGYGAGRQLYANVVAGHEEELGINAFYITSSGNGCAVFADIPEGLTRQQAQAWLAHRLGDISYDKAVHELARAAYIPSRDHFLYLNEERMFSDKPHPAVLTEDELRQWSHYDVKTARQSAAVQPQATDTPAIQPQQPSPATTVVAAKIPTPMSLTVFDAALRMAGITPQELNTVGLRHNTLKILLPTLCQMIPTASS